jgi:hypothetical protein
MREIFPAVATGARRSPRVAAKPGASGGGGGDDDDDDDDGDKNDKDFDFATFS